MPLPSLPHRWSRPALALLVGVLASCTHSDAAAHQARDAHEPSTVADSGAGAVARPPAVDSDVVRADHARVQGNENAKVWLIMASDFQCPYCKQWHDETYPLIVREYVKTGKIRMAYVNFPLVGAHPHAMQAAEAAMCAGAQNKFWAMHDELFSTQDTWAPLTNPATFFDSLALKAGVSATPWRHCVSTHAMQGLIDGDRTRDSTAGVQSTPSFIVANQLLSGADKTFNVLRPIIEAALAKAPSPAPPQGTPPVRR